MGAGPNTSQSQATGSSKWQAIKSIFKKRKSQSQIVVGNENNDSNVDKDTTTTKRKSRLSTMFRGMSMSKSTTSSRNSSVSLASVAQFVRQSIFFGGPGNASRNTSSVNGNQKTGASNMAAMLRKGKANKGANASQQNQSGSEDQGKSTHGNSKFSGGASAGPSTKKMNDQSGQVNTIQKRIDFLKMEDFNYIKEVDSGAFSTIYKCFTFDSLNQKYDVAIKRVSLQRKSNAKFLSRFLEREVLIHCALKHPNIVRYYDTLLNPGMDIYLVLEWIDKGNLLDYCRLVGRLDEETCQNLSFQLFHALAYMHNNFIVHRDIKCENILIKTQTPALHVKLADFGFCRYIGPRNTKNTQGLSLEELVEQSRCIELHDSLSAMSKLTGSLVLNQNTPIPEEIKNLASKEEKDIEESGSDPRKFTHPSLLCKTFCGSLAYSAPELVMGKLYDGRKIDVWSVGCVVFILLTHRMAFKEKGGHQNLILQQKQGVHWPTGVKDELSEMAKQFVELTLTFEDKDRPQAQELLDSHPFIANEMSDFRITKIRLSEMPRVSEQY